MKKRMKKTTPTKSTEIIEAFQKIDFSILDAEDSCEIVAKDVVVTPSPGTHESGSSNVKLNNIVDYTWEERFYTGQLLAVHVEGVYIAYGIKAVNKTVGVVRVVNRRTDARSLIKGMEGAIQDIAFAHIPSEIILACMDHKGNLFIHKVYENQVMQLLVCEQLLHILPDNSYVPQPGDISRVIWCPFIPEEAPENGQLVEIGNDISWLLALTRGNKIELWNVKLVIYSHGTRPVTPGQVVDGCVAIMEHDKSIVSASFSPDGAAIATASLDGDIKFFQVYMPSEDKPRCLHHWQPHGGEPLSSLFFLDNHKNYNPEIQFWKFAITGAKNNSELKLWSCESWTCLQNLSFQDVTNRPIKLNASIDLASGYLLLSDFYHKILYVVELFTNYKESLARIVSISEFLLPYPILSFGIVDAGVQRFKSHNLEEVCNDENDDESVLGVLITMYLVQPKSLQDGQISYIPPAPGSYDTTKLLPIKESPFYVPHEEDLHETSEDLVSPSLNQPELPANHSSLQLNLMTPDAFNSPVKHDTSGSSLIKTLVEEPSYSNTTTLVASPHTPDGVEKTLLSNGVEISNVLSEYNFASGGSSPSREVQEILSEGKCFYQETDEIQQDQDQVGLTPSGEKDVSTVWPEIPMLKMTDVRKNEEHAHKQGESSGVGDGNVWKLNTRLETSISSMINVMNSLMQASEEQASEIKQLREEMHQQHLLREVDKLISNSSQQQTLLLEKILAALDNKQQEPALKSAVSHTVSHFLSTQFLDSISSEIQKTVAPAVLNQMESLKHQVLADVSTKLNTTDYLLKENISKMVISEPVLKVLSSSVVSSLTPVISQCYKDYFTNIALPSLEKTCSAMFNQINDTFSKGSKDYVALLDAQSRRLSEKNLEQSAQLQALSEILKNNATETNKDLKKFVASIEKQVMESVSTALTMQQAALEGSVMAAVRSRAVTPAPHVIDTQLQQTQILQLISQGQINCAFQQALSASDLNLVVFVCEKVNPQQLFSQSPCPLQQHVLLSLIQQLSADMNNQTEIKHKYLEEALVNIDVNNTVTREHLPIVLSNLQRQLQTYIRSNPNNRITRSLRILLMASQTLLSDMGTGLPSR